MGDEDAAPGEPGDVVRQRHAEHTAVCRRGVQQQDAPVAGHLDVDSAEPRRKGCRGGGHDDQALVLVGQVADLPEHG
jgi:hypothetical protein